MGQGKSHLTDELQTTSLVSDQETSSVYPLLPLYEVAQEASTNKQASPGDPKAGDRDHFLANMASPLQYTSIPNNDTKVVNYDVIISRLKDNISSPKFKPRDVDELSPLLSAAKYLNLMDESDRVLIENRLRYFYVGLIYGWKIASKDAKAASMASVGIHIEPRHLGKRDKPRHRDHHRRNKNLSEIDSLKLL